MRRVRDVGPHFLWSHIYVTPETALEVHRKFKVDMYALKS